MYRLKDNDFVSATFKLDFNVSNFYIKFVCRFSDWRYKPDPNRKNSR